MWSGLIICRAPRSNYCPTALPPDSYFGGHVTGTIGTDLPKEVLRIERDWSTGDVCQYVLSGLIAGRC
jgi:hypothetical protein